MRTAGAWARWLARRAADRAARRLGYAPARLLRPEWQHVSAELELPALEEGAYHFSAYVMMPPLSDDDAAFWCRTSLERKPGPPVYALTDSSGGRVA